MKPEESILHKSTHISFDINTYVKSGLISDEFLILMLLEQKPFKVKEIASCLRLSDRTVFRYIGNLKDKGFVVRAGRTGSSLKYELTDKLAELI